MKHITLSIVLLILLHLLHLSNENNQQRDEFSLYLNKDQGYVDTVNRKEMAKMNETSKRIPATTMATICPAYSILSVANI